MARIFYIVASGGGLTGGSKMAVRHVETLRELGFDAVCYITNKVPSGIEIAAPLVQTPPQPEDVVVTPDDEAITIEQSGPSPWRTVVFAQNPYAMTGLALEALDALAAKGPPTFISVAPRLSRTLGRLYPGAEIHQVRCFADERRFGPGEKGQRLALSPKKRPAEGRLIRTLFKRMHPQHDAWRWIAIENATEQQIAGAMAEAGAFLSLSRLESVGLTTLEAMASGCVVAGFTGVGGAEYATPDNGFWAPDDDCEAAADALAKACALVDAGGPALRRRLDAGIETARAWSHAAFRAELEAAWMKLLPAARILPQPGA